MKADWPGAGHAPGAGCLPGVRGFVVRSVALCLNLAAVALSLGPKQRMQWRQLAVDFDRELAAAQ